MSKGLVEHGPDHVPTLKEVEFRTGIEFDILGAARDWFRVYGSEQEQIDHLAGTLEMAAYSHDEEQASSSPEGKPDV